MTTRRTAAAVLVAFLSSSLPLTALAQDDAVTIQARARFKEGVDAYDKGHYESARLAFLQAYSLKKHPNVLVNLAQSSAKAGHPLEAAKYFQQFLKESTTATPQQRLEAENGLVEVRRKLGRVEIIAGAGTEVTLDEKERLGNAPFSEPIDVDPGQHSLRSSGETVRVTASAGQKVQARFAGVQPVAPAAVATPTTADPNAGSPPPDSGGSRHTTLLSPPANMTPVIIGLAAAGVGLFSAIIFAAFKADAKSEADDVAKEIRDTAIQRGFDSDNNGEPDAMGVCASSNETVRKDFGGACTTLKQNNDKVDANAAIANVSVVIMFLGLGTAAGWYLFSPKRDDSHGDPKSPPSAFRPTAPVIKPYAGFGSGGLTLSGSF